MAHEMTQTVRQQDGMYYNINGYTGEVLQGPYATQEEAVMQARARSEIGGAARQGTPSLFEDAGPMGLGKLEEIMTEGYSRPEEPEFPGMEMLRPDPSPTEYGPTERRGDDVYETDYGTYSAQASPEPPPRPAPGPLMLPPNRPQPRPGLGRLAQGPQLDPRMQKMMEDTERGKTGGPSQKYFKGQPQPAPQPQAPPAGNPNLPGGGPRPGETEDQYLQRIIRGG